MFRIPVWIVTLLLLFSTLSSRTVELEGLIRPQRIRIDDRQLYVVDNERIHIFSLSDFSRITTFGKRGEGPGEFNVHPGTPMMIHVTTPRLVVQAGRKILYFKKNGDYVGEKRSRGLAICAQPLGNHFAGISYANHEGTRYLTINIYDQDLKRLKEALRIPDEIQGGKGLRFLSLPQAYTTGFAVQNERLYVAYRPDLRIDVFDPRGDNILTIQKETPPIKVSQAYKERVVGHYKTDPFLKQFMEMFKPITFPEFFPAIRDLRVSGDRVYAITYRMKGEESECLAFSTKGEFEETLYLPLVEQGLGFFPYHISKGILYQLVETEDEQWLLHINSLREK